MNNTRVRDGLVMALAWPETLCKQTGAWYEPLMKALNFNKNGFYKVGHAAVVLIPFDTGICDYYDFGRYHAPVGHGRVRNKLTDHDLIIQTKALFDADFNLLNETEILEELHQNKSCHGDGYILSSIQKTTLAKTYKTIRKFQDKVFIPYGPLIWNGTNCSRFVASVLQTAALSVIQRLALTLQPTISASPKYNVLALGRSVRQTGVQTVEHLEEVMAHKCTSA